MMRVGEEFALVFSLTAALIEHISIILVDGTLIQSVHFENRVRALHTAERENPSFFLSLFLLLQLLLLLKKEKCFLHARTTEKKK